MWSMRHITGPDGRNWTLRGAIAFDERGNGHTPCGACGALTMLGRLGPLKRKAGMRTIVYDVREKTPTGGRFGAEEKLRTGFAPTFDTVQACPSCRVKV
jgi:hypothetical protein